MRNTIIVPALASYPKPEISESEIFENQNRKRYETSITLAVGGGLFFILLGFFLVGVFTFFDRTAAALNYAGVASLIAAFVFFGLAAHFMDRFESDQRRRKPAAIERFKQKL